MRPLSAPPTPTEQTQPETSGGRPHAPKRGAARSLSPRHPKVDLHAHGAIAESGDHCRTSKLLRVWLSDVGSAAVVRLLLLLRPLLLSPPVSLPFSFLFLLFFLFIFSFLFFLFFFLFFIFLFFFFFFFF